MPLSMAGCGQTLHIKKITGQDDVRRHLANLGLVVGEEVTVMCETSGNIILCVKGSRIALGKGMANRIIV